MLILKFKYRALFVGAGALVVGSVYAVPFRDVDSFMNNNKGVLVTKTAPLTGAFSILAPGDGDSIKIGAGYTDSGTTYTDISGFRPGIDMATSASAFFYFRDDNDAAADRVNVTLDNLAFVDNYKIESPIYFGGTLAANLLVQLNSDGKLVYSVTPQGNLDFYVEYARLEVNATLGGSSQVPASVPEGGSTVALLASVLWV